MYRKADYLDLYRKADTRSLEQGFHDLYVNYYRDIAICKLCVCETTMISKEEVGVLHKHLDITFVDNENRFKHLAILFGRFAHPGVF